MYFNIVEIFYNFCGYNQIIFYYINKFTNVSIVPKVLSVVSSLFFIANFIGYYIIICVYSYSKIKNLCLTHRYVVYQRTAKYLTFVGVAYSLFGCIYTFIKFTINIPRPYCSMPNYITILDTSQERCLSGFPSAHTGLALMILYFIWPFICRKFRIAAILVFLAVAISRITLAMHYPADIIYSCIITLFIVEIAKYLCKIANQYIVSIHSLIYRILFGEK